MRVARPLLGSIIAVVAMALSALPSAAQNWPTRAVKLILPLGPGSGVDISARLIADKLSATTDKPAIPKAIVRTMSRSCSANMSRS